ncbi:T-complex protein 11-like protein 1 [Zalerion maritima]|uniref:T-complex protein 11-like protein 1 n=1 Tax=Zalerion maritima TaxID=339359 RepID=A0AAD5RX90_9PEZI|nr:T-complex protein 11-like protein 1 [Zalerion maritima]
MDPTSTNMTEPSRVLDDSRGPATPTSPRDSCQSPDLTIDIDALDENTDDENNGRIFTPPPHIAARFYRPSTARRKGSSASSRRNSISSAHSRSSRSGDARGQDGPQSKHVAWHLRRAIFYEDRKARLADRAAHAEKVRLRAALAKAAPRNAALNCEEKALAARLARQKNLDEIVAACAADVRRAKAVAETMKEKREQETERLRLQMQERMAEADRRREELRKNNAARRGRSQSNISRKNVEVMPQVKEQDSEPESDVVMVKKPPTSNAAAVRVQDWWRASCRRRALREFSELGLSIDSVSETSFDEVVDLLAKEEVVTATAKCLWICGLDEGDRGSVKEIAAVRTFLSAFLILGHSSEVLSSQQDQSEQEQDLVTKARDLLVGFENTLSRLTAFNNYTPPPALMGIIPEAYATFHNAFIAWKARDSSAMIEVMILQFIELDAIWHTVKNSPDDSVTASYRESIKENQLMLMVRIKKLAGREKGKQMIKDALEQARRERNAKKPRGDTRPRMTEQAEEDASDAMISSEKAEASASNDSSHLQTPPATPSQGASPSAPEHAHSHSHSHTQYHVHPHGFQGIIPDNRILMHELAINKEYRIDAQDYREQASRFLVPLFREMRANIDNENREAQFRFLILMSQHIKTKLQRLVKPGHSMHNLIGEILDVEVAQRQFITGSFSYERFFAAMSSLLPKLCAPIRDAEVKDLVDSKLSQGHVVDRLEALIGFIDVMLSDYANYLLRLSAPKLLEQASAYETKLFTNAMQNNTHELSVATSFWRSARAKVYAEVNRRGPEGVSHPRLRPSPERIYSQMLVDVFTALSPTTDEGMPEMLRLDHKRAIRLGRQTAHIITAGTLLLQCKSSLKRDTRRPWKTEAQRILTVLEANDPLDVFGFGVEGEECSLHASNPAQENTDIIVDGVLASLESGRLIPQQTKAQLRSAAQKVIKEMLSLRQWAHSAGGEPRNSPLEPTQGPLRILLARLRTHVLSRLAVTSASEKVKATKDAGEKLATIGLPEFVERIREMVDELSRVGLVDREAHGAWWESVAQTVEWEEAEKSQQQQPTRLQGEQAREA